ncbi:response regulator [Butyrivibrio sp. XPD2006]|uniref:response regulator n=1 Tax=Butyrivibrio sp. XPD2006 TaxID=1280668 RepID=UPI0003B7B55E|nr:response regulator [Butyrivibrio sp. XPD2006]
MKRILLIDDDEDMLAMTGRWLEKGGYEVMKAASGKEALDKISSDRPDLILLDYAMPEMDGPAVLAAIRSNPETKDIPVVYRTGMDDTDCEGSGDVRPDGIVSKSEGRPSLMKAVEEIFG